MRRRKEQIEYEEWMQNTGWLATNGQLIHVVKEASYSMDETFVEKLRIATLCGRPAFFVRTGYSVFALATVGSYYGMCKTCAEIMRQRTARQLSNSQTPALSN